jgi:hypothetical protein
MTSDVVALLQNMPDTKAIVAGLVAAGPELGVRQVADGAVVQLCDRKGRPLVSIEVPVLVQVPGEVERLLGRETADRVTPPVWWVEARARNGEGRLARAFADEMVRRLGGVVWPVREERT